MKIIEYFYLYPLILSLVLTIVINLYIYSIGLGVEDAIQMAAEDDKELEKINKLENKIGLQNFLFLICFIPLINIISCFTSLYAIYEIFTDNEDLNE